MMNPESSEPWYRRWLREWVAGSAYMAARGWVLLFVIALLLFAWIADGCPKREIPVVHPLPRAAAGLNSPLILRGLGMRRRCRGISHGRRV